MNRLSSLQTGIDVYLYHAKPSFVGWIIAPCGASFNNIKTSIQSGAGEINPINDGTKQIVNNHFCDNGHIKKAINDNSPNKLGAKDIAMYRSRLKDAEDAAKAFNSFTQTPMYTVSPFGQQIA